MNEMERAKIGRVTQELSEAWAAVEAAELPAQVWPTAMEHALAALADESSTRAGASHAVAGSADLCAPLSNESETPEGSLVLDEEFFGRMSREAELDAEVLRRGYHLRDGALISLTRTRLGATEAERNRNVAMLLAGIKWFGFGEQNVALAEVREAASTIPYSVSRNLSRHMANVLGTVLVGKGNERAIRVQTDKFGDEFSALIARLMEE